MRTLKSPQAQGLYSSQLWSLQKPEQLFLLVHWVFPTPPLGASIPTPDLLQKVGKPPRRVSREEEKGDYSVRQADMVVLAEPSP